MQRGGVPALAGGAMPLAERDVLLSEEQLRPVLLECAASASSTDLFFQDALSRFKPSKAPAPVPAAGMSRSQRAAKPLPHRPAHTNQYARPTTAPVGPHTQADVQLHYELLRGAREIWSKTDIENGHELLDDSFGEGEGDANGHPASSVRRRRATEQAAAKQRRQVELRAARESILKELQVDVTDVTSVTYVTSVTDMARAHPQRSGRCARVWSGDAHQRTHGPAACSGGEPDRAFTPDRAQARTCVCARLRRVRR